MPRKKRGQGDKPTRRPAEPAAPSPIEAKLHEIFPDVQILVPIAGGGRRAVSAWEPWQRKIIERALVGAFGEDAALETLDHPSKLPLISLLSQILSEHEQHDRHRAKTDPPA